MSQTRSIASLFEGDAKLETLNTGNKGQRWTAMSNVTTAANMFKGCAMLGAVTGMEYWDMNKVLNFSSMFQGCTVLPNRMIEQAGKWQLNTDTATTVSMANMFQGCATITTLDGLLDWNTSRVNTFAYMFENCASLLYANGVRNWTTDICMDYTAMFQGDRALKEFNAKNWVVDRGCAYENTFYLCLNLNRCVLGEGWSTIKEPTRVDPFQNIVNTQLASGQSYTWEFTAPQWADGFYVEIFNYVFDSHYPGCPTTHGYLYGAEKKGMAETLFWTDDRHGQNVGVLIDGRYCRIEIRVPGGCGAATPIHFQVHWVYPEKMIWECEEDHWTGTWDNINEGFDKYQATMAGTYVWGDFKAGARFDSNDRAWWTLEIRDDSYELVISLDEGDSTRGKVNTDPAKGLTVTETRFYVDEALKSQLGWSPCSRFKDYARYVKIVNTYNGVNVLYPNSWFENNVKLESFDGSGLTVGDATDMNRMFNNDGKLSSFTGVENWDVSHVLDFSYMFNMCASLGDISPLVGWHLNTDTGNTINMTHMFYGTRIVDLNPLAAPQPGQPTGWDMSHVLDTSYMFAENKFLVDQTPIAHWDMSTNVNFSYMFANDSALATMDLSRWQMRRVVSTSPYYAVNLDNMLVGLSSLGQLTVGESSLLQGTAFNNSLSNHGPTDGMWQLTSTRDGIGDGLLFADGRSPWFGDTSKLAARYTNDPYSADALVFKWVPKQLGGRFDSNPYAWWRYDQGPGVGYLRHAHPGRGRPRQHHQVRGCR